jgi:hypothetical protein
MPLTIKSLAQVQSLRVDLQTARDGDENQQTQTQRPSLHKQLSYR